MKYKIVTEIEVVPGVDYVSLLVTLAQGRFDKDYVPKSIITHVEPIKEGEECKAWKNNSREAR